MLCCLGLCGTVASKHSQQAGMNAGVKECVTITVMLLLLPAVVKRDVVVRPLPPSNPVFMSQAAVHTPQFKEPRIRAQNK